MKYSIGLAAVAASALACSSGAKSSVEPESALAVHGSVSQGISVNNARAIAIGQDGRTFWTYLDGCRAFTVKLPVGQSYRLVIANGRTSAGPVKIAHLMLGATGGRSAWLGANESGDVDLGTLRAAGEGPLVSIAAHAVPRAPCDGGGHDRGRDDDDNDDHDQHGDDDHRDAGASHGDDDAVCSGGTDTELEPSHDPGRRCEDRHGHSDHDHDDDKPCVGGDAGAGDAGAGDGGAGGGSGAAGSECLATADCLTGLVCTAGICRVPGGGVGSECLVTADCSAGLMCLGGICTP